MIGRPMLPTAAVRSPAAARIDSSIWVVVVLPLVPVMPSQGMILFGRLSRQASSTSLQIGTPRGRRLHQQRRGGRPAGGDHQVGVVGQRRGRAGPEPDGAAEHLEQRRLVALPGLAEVVQHGHPGPELQQPVGGGEPGDADARRPPRGLRPGRDSPLTPPVEPASATRPTAMSTTRVTSRDPLGVEDAEAGGDEQAGDDPEPHHDRHLGPVQQLEVVVDRATS